MKPEKFWQDLKSGHFASMVCETSRGQSLSNSAQVYNVIKPMTAAHPDVEVVYGIFLNGQNEVLGIETLFSGTLTCSSLYPRELVKRILELQASAVLLVHNHPSGNPEPSLDDKAVTVKVAVALAAIDVQFHDHLIIGNGFYSMADSGVMGPIKTKVKQLLTLKA